VPMIMPKKDAISFSYFEISLIAEFFSTSCTVMWDG